MRILVVDDRPDTQDTFDAFLRLSGCETDHAGDGFSALVKMDLSPPDAVVTDHVMPGMTGLEMIRKIRAEPRYQAIPVALISGLSLDELEDVYKEVFSFGGLTRCFQKPCDPNALLAWIRASVPQ